MIYLILSIISSTAIFVVFKLYERYQVDTFRAIIVNYFTAGLIGLTFYDYSLDVKEIVSRGWFIGSIILASLFIGVFYLTALTSQRNGLSVASVAMKMSLAIPVLFGILYYSEDIGPVKIIGILLALVSVYYVSAKSNAPQKVDRKNLLLPIIVFLGSGIIDASINFLENTYINNNETAIFSAVTFFFAGSIGIITILAKNRGRLRFTPKSVIGGISLAIPNYFAFYFLIEALRNSGYASSTIFPLNHVSIVALSTVLGVLFFRENLVRKNWIGLLLAVISIILIEN